MRVALITSGLLHAGALAAFLAPSPQREFTIPEAVGPALDVNIVSAQEFDALISRPPSETSLAALRTAPLPPRPRPLADDAPRPDRLPDAAPEAPEIPDLAMMEPPRVEPPPEPDRSDEAPQNDIDVRSDAPELDLNERALRDLGVDPAELLPPDPEDIQVADAPKAPPPPRGVFDAPEIDLDPDEPPEPEPDTVAESEAEPEPEPEPEPAEPAEIAEVEPEPEPTAPLRTPLPRPKPRGSLIAEAEPDSTAPPAPEEAEIDPQAPPVEVAAAPPPPRRPQRAAPNPDPSPEPVQVAEPEPAPAPEPETETQIAESPEPPVEPEPEESSDFDQLSVAELEEERRMVQELIAQMRPSVAPPEPEPEVAAEPDPAAEEAERLRAERESEAERLRAEAEADRLRAQQEAEAERRRRIEEEQRRLAEAEAERRRAIEEERRRRAEEERLRREQELARQRRMEQLARLNSQSAPESRADELLAPAPAPAAPEQGGFLGNSDTALASILSAAENASRGAQGGGGFSAGGGGGRLTQGEMQQVLDRLRSCWRVETISRNAAQKVVTLRAQVAPNRYINPASVQLVSPRPPSPDYAVAIERAQAALRDTRCQPLPFPQGKYAAWREIVITFDPARMVLQ